MPYRIKYIWALIKVNHCKEHFVGILLRISPGIGKDCVLIVSFSAKKTTDWELLLLKIVVILVIGKPAIWQNKKNLGPFPKNFI